MIQFFFILGIENHFKMSIIYMKEGGGTQLITNWAKLNIYVSPQFCCG